MDAEQVLILQSHDFQSFLKKHEDQEVAKVLLKNSFPGIPTHILGNQLHGKKIAKKKFPFLYETEGIIYPPSVHLEQSTREELAVFKSSLTSGISFVDLSCGFGIDAFFIGRNFSDISLNDPNASLLEIVRNNYERLGIHAEYHSKTAEDFLHSNQKKWDWIYLDPSRRDTLDKRKVQPQDLLPNVFDIWEDLKAHTKHLMLKLSPMMDLHSALRDFKDFKELYVLSYKNEVKELLFTFDFETSSITQKIIALDIFSQQKIECRVEDIDQNPPAFSNIEKYILVPSPAMMKLGGFQYLAEQFSIKKLHPNSHIFTSESLVQDFPGSVYPVKEISPQELKHIARAHIISKNHPLSVEEIRKKYKIKMADAPTLIFTKDISGNKILYSDGISCTA